jgi:transcriptional regulator with XRE-family HTH domain
MAAMTRPSVGQLIRRRRDEARRSQLDLALDVGVSARHLGFVELGRSRPSPGLLLAIARSLEVPLRERNQWLLAAGYAPRYPENPLAGPVLARIRDALGGLLDAHDPFPGVVVNRRWDVQLSNSAARRLVAGIPADVRGVPTNIFRVMLHPAGLAACTANFASWSGCLLRQLHLLSLSDRDAAALADEISAWPQIPPRPTWGRLARDEEPEPVMTWQVRLGGQDLSMYTIMSSFGTPTDITVSELSIELFFPADQATQDQLTPHAKPSRFDDRRAISVQRGRGQDHTARQRA